MKIQFTPKLFAVLGLVLVFSLLGVYIATITIRYSIVARGALSLVTVFMIIKTISRKKGNLDDLLSIPKSIKWYIVIVVLALIFYWALVYIVQMVVFFVR